MPPKKKPLSQVSRTARYYRTGSTVKGKSNSSSAKNARKKKASTDKKINARSEQRAKRRELAKKGREAIKRGVDTSKSDHDHAVGRRVSVKTNRGRKEKSRLIGSKRRKRN